jgi:hypothetical protein
MVVPPVIIHFRLEFSLTKTIQLLGAPILGNLHILVISLEPLGQSSLGWNRLSQHIILGTGNHVHASLSKSDNIVTIVMFSYIVAILLQSKTYIYIYILSLLSWFSERTSTGFTHVPIIDMASILNFPLWIPMGLFLYKYSRDIQKLPKYWYIQF